MTNIAILGFGVVGSGVADLLKVNKEEVERLGGDYINVKYILDIRDFEDSEFSDKIIHDFDTVLNDASVSVVIEVMGGSHPAYEYTVSALNAGKSVITSNKEVVSKYGDEFLALAKKNHVSYRFEAAVGGGIPVIAPLIAHMGQNKPKEIRGILNGTTNYILTKMFSFGESFDSALEDAKAKGYAERIPDADILGIDAARKIAILTAIVSGKLIDTSLIHTEGITEIRTDDVKFAESIGYSIKLLGRCVLDGTVPYITVSPFMISKSSMLASVNGVYNAIEYIGEPLGNALFYGKGAGAGATASAVVGDLMLVMHTEKAAAPTFVKSTDIKDFGSFKSKHYVALSSLEHAKDEIAKIAQYIAAESNSIITKEMCEDEFSTFVSSLSRSGTTVLSHIRILD